MEVQKLDSAGILELSYIGIGILGILWSYFGLYKLLLNAFSTSQTLALVLGNSLVDSYFLVIGILSIIIAACFHYYSRQSLIVAFVTSLIIIGISIAAVVIPLISFYSKTQAIEKESWTILFFVFYLPLFLPASIFNIVGAAFIGRSLRYIMFLGKGAGQTTEY